MERELARLFTLQRSGGDRRRSAFGAGGGSGRVVAIRRMRRGIAGLRPLDRASAMAIAPKLDKRSAAPSGRRGEGRESCVEHTWEPREDRPDDRAGLQGGQERSSQLFCRLRYGN